MVKIGNLNEGMKLLPKVYKTRKEATDFRDEVLRRCSYIYNKGEVVELVGKIVSRKVV